MKNNIKRFLPIVLLFIVGAIFLVEGFRDAALLRKWDNSVWVKYSGGYTFSVKKTYRNTNYLFELDNGDVLYIPSEHLAKNKTEIEKSDNLYFMYAKHKDIFSGYMHNCLAIESVDGSCVFLDKALSKRDTILGIVTFLSIGFVCVLFSVIPLLNKNIVIKVIRCFTSLSKHLSGHLSGDGSKPLKK